MPVMLHLLIAVRRVLRPLLLLQPHRRFNEANGRLCVLRLLHFQEYVDPSIPEFTVLTIMPGWKRLLFADGPRQSINALTLYAFYLSKEDDGPFWQVSKYFDGDYITSALTVSTAFTVFVFALSLLMLIIAGICYIPLLCHIQGNLKVKRICI